MDTPRLLKKRYRLGKVIGRGGMGVVWLATDEVLDRSVAVKEVSFPRGLSDDEEAKLRRRTLREARTNARLNHPNVVGVYDIVEEQDRPWIVMEFVPSRSLAETVRADGPVSPERAAAIGLQLLAGLSAAHTAGVLHRDVKPSNVLLAEDGRVVLGDFGIATAKGGSTVTSSGVLIGSPSYMAPERARGRDVGPESDLWSLGATLYTAVEGRPPFDRDSAVATLAAVVMDDPDSPERAGPLWPLIRSLLRRDPAERPEPDEVARTLREIANGTEAVPSPAPSPDSPAPELTSDPPEASEAASGAVSLAHPVERPGRASAAHPVEPPGERSAPSAPSVAVPQPRPAPDDAISPARPDDAVAEPADRDVPLDEPTAGTPDGTGTVRTEPRTSWSSPRRVAILLTTAAGILAVALLAWAVPALVGDHHPERRAARHPSTAPATSRQSPTAATSPPASPSRAPSSPDLSATTGPLPSGYHWHHDSTGFSIAVPDGWSANHHGHYLYVEDPKSSRILIVDQSDQPKSDPLKDWKEQESARRGSFPGYDRIHLRSVDYPQAEKAADWEFTYAGSGGRTHVLNRNILANSKHAYALYWQVPDSRWDASQKIFDVFASTFRPAKG